MFEGCNDPVLPVAVVRTKIQTGLGLCGSGLENLPGIFEAQGLSLRTAKNSDCDLTAFKV